MSDSIEYYRVVRDDSTGEQCPHCKRGAYWTVEWTEPDGQPCTLGQSWGDEQLAQDICDHMNMAADCMRELLEAAREATK